MCTIANWGIYRIAPSDDDIMADHYLSFSPLLLIDELSLFLHLSLASSHQPQIWLNDCSCNINRR